MQSITTDPILKSDFCSNSCRGVLNDFWSEIKFIVQGTTSQQKEIIEGTISVALGGLVSNSQIDAPKRAIVYLLLALAAIAGSLLATFSFVSTTQVGETLALVLFLAVAGLLIAGYMLGLMVLCFAIVPLGKLVGRQRDQRSVPKPT